DHWRNADHLGRLPLAGRDEVSGRAPLFGAPRGCVASTLLLSPSARRPGSWLAYHSVLTRKRERPATLQWHYKIPHTRVSRNSIIIEGSIHESDSLPQSTTGARRPRPRSSFNRKHTVAFATTRFTSVARTYPALVRHLQPVDRFDNRIPWRLVCDLADQLRSRTRSQGHRKTYEQGNRSRLPASGK